MRNTVLIILGMLLTGSLLAGEGVSFVRYRQYLQAANMANQQGDHAAALEHYRKMLAMVPYNPGIHYLTAITYARLEQPDDALAHLEQALKLGHETGGKLDVVFDGLKEHSAFGRIERLMEMRQTPVNQSEVAFTIAERDLLPEGIAFDPKSESFFLGSLWKAKIIRIDAENQVSDFTTERQDGLRSVSGMEVDPRRRVLWALSFVAPPWPVPAPEENGWSGLFKYDLKTGKLLKKYVLHESGSPHLFNDLTVSRQGDVFLTDSLAGAVYALFHGKDELELYLRSDAFMLPNGITLGEDETALYVTSSGVGVYRIDLQSKEYTLLRHPDFVSLCRIDGMYSHRNTLVCIQNGLNRIARVHLTPTGDAVEWLDIVEYGNPHFILPTTGVFVGDWFYYIANSQAYSVNRDGTLFPLEQLKEIVILKTKLP